ncbi:MAG: ABC transporter permease [Bacteroidales bacterium]|jgi:putative ABC transport system permease protein|nr:ABC transporter permease [Bacteroidales bacterium]
MFDTEVWIEIFSTIRKNKLRTFLAGFSISWGIFMFCILLEAGNGFRNGLKDGFSKQAVNTIRYFGRRTSIPYMGLPDKRLIKLDDTDVAASGQLDAVGVVSPVIFKYLPVNRLLNSTYATVVGVIPDYMEIAKADLQHGRFLNDIDMNEKRKVAVVNERLRAVLFPDEEPLGKPVSIGKLSFTVVGVVKENMASGEERIFIPYDVAQLIYTRGGRGLSTIDFTVQGLDTEEKNTEFERLLNRQTSALHFYAPDDDVAIGINNQTQQYLQFLGISNAVTLFIWIIGLGTLLAGIIGIGNIMLIIVRERTREIGIRKALGARPLNILGNILLESVFITFVSGYAGMFAGITVGEVITWLLERFGIDAFMFKNPTIDIDMALGALVVLIIAGLLAGYFPARNAVRIPPVEAMRASD